MNDKNEINEYYKRGNIWYVLLIIVFLMTLTAAVLCTILYGYYETGHDTLELSMVNKESVSIFKSTYTDEDGIVMVKSNDGREVIAPGAGSSYTFRIVNTYKMAMDYGLSIRPETNSTARNRFYLPIELRMYDQYGRYVIGGENAWVRADKLETYETNGTLLDREAIELTLEWRWPFESGNNSYDTWLGSLQGDDVPTFSLNCSTESTPNYDAGGSPAEYNIYRTRMYLPLLILLWILLILVLCLLVTTAKRRRAYRKSLASGGTETAEPEGREEE